MNNNDDNREIRRQRGIAWQTIYYIKLQFPFVCLSVPLLFFPTRQSDRNQIWHTYSGRYGTHSQLKKMDPPHPRGVPWGFYGVKLKKKPSGGGGGGSFRGSKKSKVREMSWTAQKINTFFNPPPRMERGKGGREGGRKGEGGRQGRRGPSEAG